MTIREYDSLPKPLETYSNVVKSLLPLEKIPVVNNLLGVTAKSKTDNLPEVTYAVNNLAIDVDHLNRYNQICGFKAVSYTHLTLPTIYSV